jgi:hypothetical protein
MVVRPTSPARPPETRVEDPTRASAASEGSRGSGGSAVQGRRTSVGSGADPAGGLALAEGECHMLLALESAEC